MTLAVPRMNVPAELAPADDVSLAFVLHGATACRPTAARTARGSFLLPKAQLTTLAGAPAGTHFAGPSWQSTDSSSAVGRKIKEAAVDATAIPWLFLKVSSHNGNPGQLADVTQIQRLETTGGLAPTTPCTADARLDVPYTANYYFYRKHPGGLRCGVAPAAR